MPPIRDAPPAAGTPTSAERFKAGDAASYDAVADEFERLTQEFTAPIARRLVEFAGVSRADCVLDVGCGTGVVTRLVARQLHAPGKVVGLDLSDGMLAAAARLASSEGLQAVTEFHKGDAEHLDFAEERFDKVVSLYALRHFPDPAAALAEMFRVLKREGRALVAVGSAPPLLSTGFFKVGCEVALERARSLAGRGPLYATDLIEHLLDKHLGTTPPEQHAGWTHGVAGFATAVKQLMRTAGFAHVRAVWAGNTVRMDSAEKFWAVQATFSSRARKQLPETPTDLAAAVRQDFLQICRHRLARGGELIYRTGALVGIGSRA
jgi:ubiquinone/menaquinone biosynthesis C-methylase UbiE